MTTVREVIEFLKSGYLDLDEEVLWQVIAQKHTDVGNKEQWDAFVGDIQGCFGDYVSGEAHQFVIDNHEYFI